MSAAIGPGPMGKVFIARPCRAVIKSVCGGKAVTVQSGSVCIARENLGLPVFCSIER